MVPKTKVFGNKRYMLLSRHKLAKGRALEVAGEYRTAGKLARVVKSLTSMGNPQYHVYVHK